jgi:hypothetical protein
MMIQLTSREKSGYFNFPQNLGMSSTASFIQNESNEIKAELNRTNTFGEHISILLERLNQLFKEYSKEPWDGEESERIDEKSYSTAINVALSLPYDLPIPEINIRPSDGGVIFEWFRGSRQVFSFEVGRQNELFYAGLFGVIQSNGIEFFYDTIPDNIIANIRRLFV